MKVKILAVHDKEHFVDIAELRGELSGLEAGQRLARPSGVPDIPSRGNRTELSVVRGDLNLLQNPLSGDDLIWTHHKQKLVGSEYAVAGQDI